MLGTHPTRGKNRRPARLRAPANLVPQDAHKFGFHTLTNRLPRVRKTPMRSERGYGRGPFGVTAPHSRSARTRRCAEPRRLVMHATATVQSQDYRAVKRKIKTYPRLQRIPMYACSAAEVSQSRNNSTAWRHKNRNIAFAKWKTRAAFSFSKRLTRQKQKFKCLIRFMRSSSTADMISPSLRRTAAASCVDHPAAASSNSRRILPCQSSTIIDQITL